MERQRQPGADRLRDSGDGPPGADSLNQHRREFDDSLQQTDQAFDTINSLHAQDYLQQNLQTGGQ